MAKFDDLLDGESPYEIKRKRIIYLKDAAQKMKSGKEMMSKYKYVLIPFAIIPLFWPFLFFAYHLFKKQMKLRESQFLMALQYWKLEISDLQ